MVAERSHTLPSAAELMAAFRLGTRPIERGHFLFQSDLAEALFALGDRSMIPELVTLLASNSRETRVNAAWVLARLGAPRGIDLVSAEAREQSPAGRAREGVEFTEHNRVVRQMLLACPSSSRRRTTRAAKRRCRSLRLLQSSAVNAARRFSFSS